MSERPPDSQNPTHTSGSSKEDAAGGDPAPSPRTLGDFEILREIGRGGMGVVYEARQLSLNRRVALKVLPPALGLGKQAAQRFEREAHAAAKLHHTNIVPVYAIGEQDGSHFYAMELVDGQPLDRILRELAGGESSPLMDATVTRAAETPPAADTAVADRESATTSLSETSAGGREWFDAVARLTAEVADGLDYAHGRGVVHRDVKPANLLLSGDGRLRVTDFGLARIAQEPGLTVSGSFLGTPAYMSPEQIAAGRMKLDHRTDVYSLGAVLYEMLTLQRPFGGQSREEIVAAIMTKDPRPPRRHNGKIPVDLETICLKAMERDPDRRYQTAGEMAHDLRQYLHGGLIAARRAGWLRRGWKAIRRHPVAATVAVAALLVALVGAQAWRTSVQRGEEAIGRALADAKLAESQGQSREALRKADLVLAERPDDPDARLIRAHALMDQLRVKEALDEGLAMVAKDPDDWIGHLIVARAAGHGAFYGGEIEPHVEAVERLAPDTADAYALRARLAGSDPSRIELLDRALDLDPGHPDALWSRAWAHVRLKDFQAAIANAGRLTVSRPQASWGHLLESMVYERLHDRERALAAAERAIEVAPEDPMVYFNRSGIYGDLFGNNEKALADISRALEMDPENTGFLLVRADMHSAEGREEEALADARLAAEIDPTSPWPVRTQIWAHHRLGHDEEVDRLLEEHDRLAESWGDPDKRDEAHKQRAWVLQLRGDYEGALAALESALELDPESWYKILRGARLKRLLGDERGFEADCDLAAGEDLDDVEGLRNRATQLMTLCDRTEQAMADLTRCIELAPSWADAYLARAVVYTETGNQKAALADLNRCVELAPAWGACTWSRSLIHNQLGRFDDALADADELVRLVPEEAMAHAFRADLLQVVGRLAEALESAERSIQLAPSTAFPYLIRAAILVQEGRCDRVEEDIQKALELSPRSSQVMGIVASLHVHGLVYHCPDQYDLDLALDLARRALELGPSDEVTRRALAVARYRSGAYAEAIEHHERTATATGGGAIDGFFLAMEHWKLGRRAEARDHYDGAVAWMEAHNPDSPALREFRSEAEQVLGIRP